MSSRNRGKVKNVSNLVITSQPYVWKANCKYGHYINKLYILMFRICEIHLFVMLSWKKIFCRHSLISSIDIINVLILWVLESCASCFLVQDWWHRARNSHITEDNAWQWHGLVGHTTTKCDIWRQWWNFWHNDLFAIPLRYTDQYDMSVKLHVNKVFIHIKQGCSHRFGQHASKKLTIRSMVRPLNVF